MYFLSSGLTISRVNSSWFLRKVTHWHSLGMSGVSSKMFLRLVQSCALMDMKIRGITGKWNPMWNSSESPKYSRTSMGGWQASAKMILPDHWGIYNHLGTRRPSSFSSVSGSREWQRDSHSWYLLFRLQSSESSGHTQVRNSINSKTINTEIQPKSHHIQHFLLELRVVEAKIWMRMLNELEIRLWREESVPVVLTSNRIKGLRCVKEVIVPNWMAQCR